MYRSARHGCYSNWHTFPYLMAAFAARRHGQRDAPFGWDDERDRAGRGRKRMFDAADLRLVLLKLISDQPRHGYDLIRAIEALTSGNYVPSAGVVYPALAVLQDLNQIEGTGPEGNRKAFSVTADGTAELAANAERVETLFARLAALAGTPEPGDSAPVRRAMHNLRTALWQQLQRPQASRDRWHAIAAILDEATQRIDRV
jgi:DNA-binding PadR family transcriptional regulator